MPTERFFRLPREKQNAIKQAAFREFAAQPLELVSINRIVKDADISRGSFYTYFEDKWDLLNYLLESYQRTIEREAQKSLKETGGDVWEMFGDIFQMILDHCQDPQVRDFIGHILVNENPESALKLFPCVEESEKNADMERKLRTFYEAYKEEKFRKMPFSRFQNFMQLAMLSVLYELSRYAGGAEEQCVIEEFREKMSILRSGVAVIGEVCPKSEGQDGR
ncbi:TetR/AcrR family transcriptional regulator [[Clostridium] aminophilum]|uniref:TetR/AcrR family transcriptional regulator n=1 Tax=[Clostridium] aminophilum TaxID=1526 RepID=UPI0033330CCC